MSADGLSVRAAPLAYLVGLGLSPWYLPPSASKCAPRTTPLYSPPLCFTQGTPPCMCSTVFGPLVMRLIDYAKSPDTRQT